MNAGEATVEWLFREQLKVDAEWSTQIESGFRWWADRNAQTIEVAGQDSGPDGETRYLVSVRTELVRSLDLGDREAEAINERVMQFASMAGPIYDAKTKTLGLASLVRVYDRISGVMNPLISVAAVLQIGEARIIGSELAKLLRAQEALSGPTDRGLRPKPDEMADIIEPMILPAGKQPSRWSSAEFEECVNRYMSRPPALRANADPYGFTVVFPYGDHQSSLCQAKANEPHPYYGNGLLVVQRFPVAPPSEAAGAALALLMNQAELAEFRPGGFSFGTFGFGSYCYRNNVLHFSAFFPNFLYQPGLLGGIYWSCAHRSREMSALLARHNA